MTTATVPIDITSTHNVTDHRPHRHVPHFAQIPNEAISILTPYSGLILTLWMVILFLVRHYLLEGWAFARIYGRKYFAMDDGLKRGFMNHHIAGAVKIILLVAGAKPFVDVVFGKATLNSPLGRTYHPTMGDILLVLTQLFVAMYVFELFYRKTLSPIAVMHHVGAIVIAQSAVVLSLDLREEVNATMEFVLCLVWGAFDVLAEFWLNLAFILYRVHANNHSFLSYLFYSTCMITIMGSVAETIMIMTLFGQSWDKWALSFKVITPILHTIFTLAQLHGSRILYAMWTKQKRLLAEEEGRISDPEGLRQRKKEEEDGDEGHSSPRLFVSSNNDSEISSQPRRDALPERPRPTKKPSKLVILYNRFTGGRATS